MLRSPIAVKVIGRETVGAEGRCRQIQEDLMLLKRSLVLALGIVALVALSWSEGAVAKLSANGIGLANGISLGNGIHLGNGINLGNGIEISTTTLQAVRLAMPDGTEVNFR
jgi:hypothetical protein